MDRYLWVNRNREYKHDIPVLNMGNQENGDNIPETEVRRESVCGCSVVVRSGEMNLTSHIVEPFWQTWGLPSISLALPTEPRNELCMQWVLNECYW